MTPVPKPRSTPSRPLLAVILTGVLLALTACSLPAPMLQQTDGSAAPAPEAGLEEYYEQTVQWDSCGQDFECGAVTVPIDYDDPGAGTIDIQLKKYGLSSADGMILINPGGPGASGIETVDVAPHIFTSELREQREIVGFDPRGVGESAPISCFDDEQLDEWYTTLYDVETDAGWQDYLDAVTEYVTACETNNSEIIGHVDTVSAARDMDVIRAALDIDLLDYLGFSYGTKLGATYADLFGANVGRFVLDGAVDLTLTNEELGFGQAEGFERAYRVFLDDCLTGPDCPFVGSVDEAYEDTLQLVDELSERPMDSGDPDRPVTDGDLLNAIILTLYSTDNWPLLSGAISALRSGDGSQVKFLSDYALERDEDGHYEPGDGAQVAINCLDHPSDEEIDYDEVTAEAAELEDISPLFGPALGYGEVACAKFPIKTDFGPRAIEAPEAPTMVVIGTTGDPATPYEWSEAMVDQLADAVLLTWDGEGHTAYGNGSCIDEAVDEYFINGILPEDGLRC